jgi:site-specific recombinase XerD
MTPLRQRFVQDLQIRNYAPRTISTYVAAVIAFARHFGRSPEQLDAEHVRQYQLHLLGLRASWSRFNQVVSALRLLYAITLRRADMVPLIPYGKRPKVLPVVLSPDEVRRLFAVVTDPFYLLILQTSYAAGLRVSEVVRLRVTDIDAGRMVLHIRCAKGHKDRLVPLSKLLLQRLRQYWQKYRPRDFLFPGQSGTAPISIGQVQRICRQAVRASGIRKKASMHTLRHSYATHLLESGVNLVTLQKLLGHSQISTTVGYTHVEQAHLLKTGSPLDTLPIAPVSGEPPCALPPWMSEPSSAAGSQTPESPAG